MIHSFRRLVIRQIHRFVYRTKYVINRTIFRLTGYELRKSGEVNDLTYSPFELKVWAQVKDRTMTPISSVSNLVSLSNYIVRNNIPGAFVECGVWRGGSSLAFAFSILELTETPIDIYLYDTFEGFTDVGPKDIEIKTGKSAQELLGIDPNYLCRATLQDVAEGFKRIGYPEKHLQFIKGDVTETLKIKKPPLISVLRLDTDYYESTKVELDELFPLLAPGGVLIIDDYDVWDGSRRAVEEYFGDKLESYFFVRVESGRLLLKH